MNEQPTSGDSYSEIETLRGAGATHYHSLQIKIFSQHFINMHRLSLIHSCLAVVMFTLLLLSSDAADFSNPFTNRTMEFSMSCRRNETGHLLTDFLLKKTSPELPKYWRLNWEHGATESGGLQTFYLHAAIVVNPPVPAGYQLFHGIGYYKFHRAGVFFDVASAICAAEGGHLVIINSESEAGVVKTLFQANKDTGSWAWVGFHDRLKEGEFVTIFGQPLRSTGYHRWLNANEPNGGTNENCGGVAHNALLVDAFCDTNLPFICEYDLSWTDS